MESIHIVLEIDATTTGADEAAAMQKALLETARSAMLHPGDKPQEEELARVIGLAIQLIPAIRTDKEKEESDERTE